MHNRGFVVELDPRQEEGGQEMTINEAITLAREDAEVAIAWARGGDSPIVWLTGNSYMPPLRDFGRAEQVWQTNEMDAWEAYSEEFLEVMEHGQVFVACPDYDNALYAVDLTRWQYVEHDDDGAETLEDEWEAIG